MCAKKLSQQKTEGVLRSSPELAEANEALRIEITERQQAEKQITRQNALLAGINRVLQEALTSESEEEVAGICLQVAEKLTGSKFGFIDELNEAGRVDAIALSNPGWDAGKMPKSDAVRLLKNMEVRGIYASVIRDGKSVIINEPTSHPEWFGLPEGHPPLTCFLGVALKYGGKTIGLIGLGNKEWGYELADQQDIETLSVTFAEALMRNRAEVKIKNLNGNLERQIAELQAINEELEAFGYSVSHDLRAPLRSIEGFSRALLEDYAGALNGQGNDYLRRVEEAAQKMNQLIDAILALCQVAKDELHREEVDLSAMVKKIHGELKERQAERQVEFLISPGLVVNGDARLLRIMMENLLENAWKFVGKNPRAKIEFGVTRQGDKTAYFVRDDGSGFDMAEAEKLFIPFQRLHGANEFPGMGIGLATVRRIIHRHGGRVWAEGQVGKGATFYFTLGN